MKYCKSPTEIPKIPHFAIVEFSQVHHEGDERSRTNPGHGYPAYSETVCQYISFDSKTAWEQEISKRMQSKYGRKDDFVAITATQAQITTQTIVNVK